METVVPRAKFAGDFMRASRERRTANGLRLRCSRSAFVKMAAYTATRRAVDTLFNFGILFFKGGEPRNAVSIYVGQRAAHG